MKEIKVYHVQGYSNYSCWIPNKKIVSNLDDADVVVFEGGEDIDPNFYKNPQPKHRFTHHNTERDIYEIAVYKKALSKNKFILGICRGSQFICSQQENGMLVQHQPNPSFLHEIKTFDNKNLIISSTHHQAMYPYKMNKEDYNILAWTENYLKFHEDGNEEELNPEKECEIVYFPKVKSLGIQGHPEMIVDKLPETINWLQKLFLDLYINPEENEK